MRKRNLFALILFCAEILLITSSFALDIERTVLDNGLILLTVERRNLPVVRVNAGVNAGSLKEAEKKAGLAHLVASLLTGGTGRRTAHQISEEIDFVGGALGASGGDDYITVNLSILKKDIHLGFDLLSDIMLNPIFPEDELRKKIERIKGSLRAQEEDPSFVVSREFERLVFGDHPYGRLITGTAESLDGITRDDLLAFHSQWYLPNNTIMAVVGDISTKEVKALLNQYFSTWMRNDVIDPIVPEISNMKEQKTHLVDKNITQANIILGHIGVKRSNPDYYAISVMNYILGGGGFASRLMQNIREDRGLAYDVHSFFAADKDGGSFKVGLQTKNESAHVAINEIVNEMKRIRNGPVSDTELADAKSFLTGSFPMRIETGQRIANFLVAVEYYGLGSDYSEKYPSYINAVTKEDVLRVARQYLNPEQFILVIVADQGKVQLPDEYQQ